MTTVPARDLRNHTADVLKRVQDGDDVTITSNGVPVATMVAVRGGKRASIPKAEFLRIRQADPALKADLALLTGDSTDDLGPIE